MRIVLKVAVIAHIEDDTAPSLDTYGEEAMKHKESSRRTQLAYPIQTNLGFVGAVSGREDATKLIEMVSSGIEKTAHNLSLVPAHAPKGNG